MGATIRGEVSAEESGMILARDGDHVNLDSIRTHDALSPQRKEHDNAQTRRSLSFKLSEVLRLQ